MRSKLYVLTTLSIVSLIGAIGMYQTQFPDFQRQGFDDGETQIEVQSRIERALPHREFSVQFWGLVNYLLFNEGRDGVIVGDQGWLYTDEELYLTQGFEARFADRLHEIVETKRILEKQNVELIVALLPDKSRVVRKHLKVQPPPAVESRYAKARQHLLDAQIRAPDLYMLLQKEHAIAPVFQERDTHWSPSGARAVARALAPIVHMFETSEVAFTLETSAPIVREGDLLDFVPVGPLSHLLGLTAEPVEQFEVFNSGGQGGLFGETPKVKIALVGSSYSADPVWNFLDFLQYEAQRDVLNYSEVGTGPFQPMRNFLQTLSDDRSSLKVVIWEIPERYLMMEGY